MNMLAGEGSSLAPLPFPLKPWRLTSQPWIFQGNFSGRRMAVFCLFLLSPNALSSQEAGGADQIRHRGR